MPNMNSGTERPYAPLLEPYIMLRCSIAWKEYSTDHGFYDLTFNDI